MYKRQSSDSDFTGLAARIREQGIDVYGFGEQKTPESFRQACRRFIYTENLLPEAPTSEEPERADLRPAAAKQAPSAAAPLIRKAIAQLDDDGGWVPLGRVGQRLAELASDFDPRTYGQAKLSDLVAVSYTHLDVYKRQEPRAAGVGPPHPSRRSIDAA